MPIMNAQTFEELSLEEKIDLLTCKGSYLMSRKNSMYNIFLYGVSGLYVEVLYFRKNNRIQNIIEISSNKVMDYYLEEMVVEVA